jgi:iron-sulfur cluster repair protein YtfE (RIC family)
MLSSSQSIRDIAADLPSAVALFERFEIDACSLGDKSLKEACSELHLSLDQVLEKLQECRERESVIINVYATIFRVWRGRRASSQTQWAINLASLRQ